MKDLREAKKI